MGDRAAPATPEPASGSSHRRENGDIPAARMVFVLVDAKFIRGRVLAAARP